MPLFFLILNKPITTPTDSAWKIAPPRPPAPDARLTTRQPPHHTAPRVPAPDHRPTRTHTVDSDRARRPAVERDREHRSLPSPRRRRDRVCSPREIIRPIEGDGDAAGSTREVNEVGAEAVRSTVGHLVGARRDSD